MLTPAHKVIEICGGYHAVAEMTGRHETRVRRWTYAKDKGGTGGLIPSDMQQVLLDGARERGIDLRPEHFFRPDVASDTDASASAPPDAPQTEAAE